jgi:hypothetical protein
MQQSVGAPSVARLRLIDHFKRAYQIIVGLAITNASTNLLFGGSAEFSGTAVWMFCTLFITVVPIFHGGDRSLDLKYLGAQPVGFWGRVAYVWDVYMLLITAIFFVKIAQHIAPPDAKNGQTDIGQIRDFYWWMMAMLLFDVAVLIIDRIKSSLLGTQGQDELSAYWKWIVLNLLLGLVCLWLWHDIPRGSFFCGTATSLYIASIIVFVLAFFRTILDYAFGKEFMFP